ncbi:transposase [Ectothiorhodospiraceae bacterium WFHF3C12]|nr:transposase [Ectothiorhodospiraceae bacterium WFHF3C12]
MPWWGYVLVTLGLTHVTIASVTIYLHRHQAHRGLDLHPAAAHFFRFWLWLTTGMITAQWVAVHRKHHAKCETPDDPHSPQVLGIRQVMLRGSEIYREAATDPETLANYAHGTPRDWLERNIYSRHNILGVTLLALIDLACFGVVGITIWAVQMLWIPVWAAGMVNGLGHYLGYRNFEPADASTNLVPWGVLIGGEELHNNHHAFPSSAKLSNKRWELDIGWAYIRLMEMAGLARVKRVAPMPAIDRAKTDVDMDTVAAVVRARVHVMALYAREVIGPTIRAEISRADESYRHFLKRARRLMVREESLISERNQARLQKALSRSEQLALVYQYRQRLQDLWRQSGVTREALRDGLREWCRQAEASGVSTLQNFAQHLRGFTLVQQPTAA